VDGYVKIGDTVRIFEYNGCHWHGCECGKGHKDLAVRVKQRLAWEKKKAMLVNHGEVIVMWECEWREFMDENPEIEKTDTHFPHIMKKEQSEIGLRNAIKEGSFFGFINCDLW